MAAKSISAAISMIGLVDDRLSVIFFRFSCLRAPYGRAANK